MLSLPDDVALPDPRELVPTMVALHQRHPQLNVMNVEAAAAAALLEARVLLSACGAEGVLPAVLDADAIPWRIVSIG